MRKPSPVPTRACAASPATSTSSSAAARKRGCTVRSLRIPASAVVHQGQLTGVFIVDENRIARFRLIRAGREFGEQVEVISGIKDDTLLVTAPPPQLINGSAVEFEK